MADYIIREAAMSMPWANGQYDHEHANEHFIYGLETYKEWLEYVPAADVRPVVHGEWVYEEPNGANNFKGCYWCDQCHQPINHKKNFCPNCGADMREVKADG